MQAASGAPDDGDGNESPSSNASSSLSSVPGSEDETEEDSSSSNDSDSNGKKRAGSSSHKRRRNLDEDGNERGNGPSKKRRANGQSLSNDLGEATSTTNSNANLQANISFDSQATVEDATVEIHIGRQPYILDPSDQSIFPPWDTTRTSWPSGTTSLPDFATISASELDLWKAASTDIQQKLASHRGQATLATWRAELHIKYKRTFLYEPDANFSGVWMHDPTALDASTAREILSTPDPNFRNGEIRRRVMLAYEPHMLARVEAHPKPKPANPRITVQAGTFDEPQSFSEDVHGGGNGLPGARDGKGDRACR